MTKRAKILRYLSKVEEATLSDIMKHTNVNDYYNNGEKYLRAMLSRMVKSGYITRVRTGVYAFKTNNPPT